jgi:hypothetical protein
MCFGSIKIEDKLVPALTCPADVTIACSESTDVSNTGQVLIDDCSSTAVQIENNIIDNGECGNPRQIINRRFVVTDLWGNQSICAQKITVIPFDLNDMIMPADVVVNCESAYLNAAATSPAATGQPTINGEPVGTGLCSATLGYTDVVLEGCAGSREILRTWTVKNSCMPIGPGNPVTHHTGYPRERLRRTTTVMPG